jgi:hypothetical protein
MTRIEVRAALLPSCRLTSTVARIFLIGYGALSGMHSAHWTEMVWPYWVYGVPANSAPLYDRC